MNVSRRRFLELLGTAAVGSTVAYSFPSIIVPRNLAWGWQKFGLTMLDVGPLQPHWPVTFGVDWGHDFSTGVYYIVKEQCIIKDGVITIPTFTVPPSRETATIP